MANKETIELVKQLRISGENLSELSRRFNVSRSTIRDWLVKSTDEVVDNFFDNFLYKLEHDEIFNFNYYYLLGQYFGDGYIYQIQRTTRLRISTSDIHTNIRQEIINALLLIFPNNKIQYIKKAGCTEVGIYSNRLPEIFPHLGAGTKHTRKIELAEWQLSHINHRALLRGLIHSDGTSFYRTQSGKKYLNYGFNNCSIDIVNMLIDCLNVEGINYKMYNKTLDSNNKHLQKVITICRRPDVEKMFNICGIKS